jgi:hypothetical protein
MSFSGCKTCKEGRLVVGEAETIATSSERGRKTQKKVIRACARGAHAPGRWPRVRARGTAVDDETSSWWSTVSCEPDDGGTPENRCVMAEKLETQWRRVLFTRGDMVAEAVSLDRKK